MGKAVGLPLRSGKAASVAGKSRRGEAVASVVTVREAAAVLTGLMQAHVKVRGEAQPSEALPTVTERQLRYAAAHGVIRLSRKPRGRGDTALIESRELAVFYIFWALSRHHPDRRMPWATLQFCGEAIRAGLTVEGPEMVLHISQRPPYPGVPRVIPRGQCEPDAYVCMSLLDVRSMIDRRIIELRASRPDVYVSGRFVSVAELIEANQTAH